jgi:tetratricopeptide (TPR) repeat protein
MKNLLLLSLLVTVLFGCDSESKKAPTENDYHLGEIQYSFSISEAARPDFEKGLLLLHSFEYEDGIDAFSAAQKADSTEIMAYWGEAMCHYKALWGLQDVDAGRAVMQKLGATEEERHEKTEEGIERDFWKSIELLYGEGEVKDRNRNYVAHMEALYEKYPKDLEVAAFYSLGLMWADYKNQEYLDRSAEVALGIIEMNPIHPGGLHYMIHANDNPEHASNALEAANSYADVAPDAAHALHMPSHIYVALGMWNEVVASNIAAYEASLHRKELKGLDGSAREYHSFAWQHYGHLQKGDYQSAARLLEEMISYYPDHGSWERSQGYLSYLVTMQNEQYIEAGEWPANLTPIDVDCNLLGLAHKSGFHFFKGYTAYQNSDAESLNKEIEDLTVQLHIAEVLVNDDGVSLCSAGPTRYAPNQTRVNKTKAVILQLKAMAAMLEGDDSLAEMHMQEAVEIEENEKYDSGPPFIAYPTFEQYGEWLLTQGRAEDALVQFEKSLEGRSNRSKALRGKIAALQTLDRHDEAAEVQKVLDGFWIGDEGAAIEL